MSSSFSSIIAISLAYVWVDIDRTDGIAISVWHDLDFSVSRISPSIGFISTLVWIASPISWRLVEQSYLFSIVFLFWVGFVYEKIVGTTFPVKILLVDIPSNSFWREEKKCILSQNWYSIPTDKWSKYNGWKILLILKSLLRQVLSK